MVTGPMARPSRPSVGAAYDDKDGERNEKYPQIRLKLLEKRERQSGIEARIDIEPDSRHQGHQGLAHQFGPAAQPLIMLFDDLEIVVPKTDDAKPQGHQDQEPDIGIVQFGPEQGGRQGGENDHQPPHGGGAVFGVMRLGALFPDRLADLQLLELADEPGPHQHGNNQGRQNGKDGPEGYVPEDIEPAENRF